MKRICTIKLLAVMLALMFFIPNTYAIKRGKRYSTTPRKAVPKTALSRRIEHCRQRHTTKQLPGKSGMLLNASKRENALRPMQTLGLKHLENALAYDRFFTHTMKEVPNETMEQAQQEIYVRANEFVTQKGRWMEFYGTDVTEKEKLLGMLAARVMLYGDINTPAVAQLIELYNSLIPFSQKKRELVTTTRDMIQFIQREDRMMKMDSPASEKSVEADLAKRVQFFIAYHDGLFDPVLKEFEGILNYMQYKEMQKTTLRELKDFIAREGRLPQTYGWNVNLDISKYTKEQQYEIHLYGRAVNYSRQSQHYGITEVAKQIRELWEQYGGQ